MTIRNQTIAAAQKLMDVLCDVSALCPDAGREIYKFSADKISEVQDIFIILRSLHEDDLEDTEKYKLLTDGTLRDTMTSLTDQFHNCLTKNKFRPSVERLGRKLTQEWNTLNAD